MSRYEAYPEYRDSGVEWLGNIPNGWRIQKQKYILESLESGVSVNAADVSTQDGQIGVLKTSCVYTRKFRPEENKTVLPEELVRVRCPVKNQSIIISRMNTPDLVGAAAYVEHEYDNLYLPDRLWQTTVCDNVKYSTKYLWYNMFLKGFRDQTASAAEGASSSMQNIAQDDFLAINVCVPSGQEQYGIASFLDHETAKIDTLIEKQQQLIKLLKEKRQAVISHAVTKGLNPDAPMKDSGVEWLGEVPAHWKIVRINQLFSESAARATSPVELTFPVLSVSIHHGISDKELDEEESDRKLQRSEDKSLYKIVHQNYLAYNMMRAWQGGFGASKISGLVSPAYVVCVPETSLETSYFELVLRTDNAITKLKRYSRGITDFRLRLYWEEFKNILVPVPPKSEVDQILESVIELQQSYANLISVSSKQIGLLKERRTALISAAVTGKIDVRNWQPPEPTSTPSTDA